MTDWFENDALFKRQLLEGRKWEEHVKNRIQEWGFKAHLGALAIRGDVAEAGKFLGQTDLKVYGYTFEVKSRSVWFTHPLNFPFSDIMIDTVSSVNGKPDAHMYVCVSQRTSKLIALPVDMTRHLWRTIQRYDNTRGITDNFYTCDREHWKNEEWLQWALAKAKRSPLE
jgi:hypothetical protein